MSLILYGFSIVAKPIERLFVRKYSKDAIAQQPIFIIGAPRTGSTILYQALTNTTDVLYIDNLAQRFYRNLFLGTWLSQKLFGNKPHNNFKAEHGSTKQYGLHAPSECGEFWYRWLPKDQHFIDDPEISEKMVSEIRDEITAISNFHKKPILFKNLNAGQRLRLIKKAFPKARVIFITRDARFTVSSILNARKKNNVQAGEWWSIKPKNYQELIKLSELDMCMAQIFYIEEQIKHDSGLFSQKDFKEVDYSDLSRKTVEDIISWLNIDMKDGSLPDFFKDDIGKMEPMKQESLTIAASKYGLEKGFH